MRVSVLMKTTQTLDSPERLTHFYSIFLKNPSKLYQLNCGLKTIALQITTRKMQKKKTKKNLKNNNEFHVSFSVSLG